MIKKYIENMKNPKALGLKVITTRTTDIQPIMLTSFER